MCVIHILKYFDGRMAVTFTIKLLIVTRHMNVGGIQKSLIELLKVLSKDEKYDISLFCCLKRGPLLTHLPENIKILDENPYAAISEISVSECKKMGIKYALIRGVLSVWTKLFTKKIPIKLFSRLVGKIGDSYDISVSYAQPMEDHSFCALTNELVLNCTDAKKKVGFVHSDFANYGGNTPLNRAIYPCFDNVAAVTESLKRSFIQIMPEIADKVHTVYNICDISRVKELAEESPVEYDLAVTTFVTVARLGEEKGHIRCLAAFAHLREEGFDFRWHIVGGGELYDRINSEILYYGLEDCVILEGEHTNPYRYVKNADYFLLPSIHEGAGIVFLEAQTLGVSILSTDTLSAKELVGNKNFGYVCKNNEDGIYDMLKKALCNNLGPFNKEIPDCSITKKQFDKLCSDKLNRE